MAFINNIYIHVVKESFDHPVDTTSHATEDGLPLTDTVREQSKSLSLSGKIVDVNGLTASEAIAKIKKMQLAGTLVEYNGAIGIVRNYQIKDFSTDYNNKNYGGADFSMTLQEIRIAKSAYKKSSTSIKTVKTNFVVGDKVIFTGGDVYVSSDATSPAANRKRGECTLTKISNKSWSIHQFHLISNDGGKVYGWVDKSKVTPISTKASSSNNGGIQHTGATTTSTTIYHTVKSGDTLYSIVSKYKTRLNFNNGVTVGTYYIQIMYDNPSAFSKKNDEKTLQVGARLAIQTEVRKSLITEIEITAGDVR